MTRSEHEINGSNNCDNLTMPDEAPHERRPRTPLPRGDDNQAKGFWRTVGGRFWVLVLVLLALNYLSVAIFAPGREKSNQFQQRAGFPNALCAG